LTVTVIVSACVIVIADDFSVDTPSVNATMLEGTSIIVVTINRSMNTSRFSVTGVSCTCAIVIAIDFVVDTTGLRVTGIIGTCIIIVTIYTLVNTTSIGVATIGCAVVIIITVNSIGIAPSGIITTVCVTFALVGTPCGVVYEDTTLDRIAACCLTSGAVVA